MTAYNAKIEQTGSHYVVGFDGDSKNDDDHRIED